MSYAAALSYPLGTSGPDWVVWPLVVRNGASRKSVFIMWNQANSSRLVGVRNTSVLTSSLSIRANNPCVHAQMVWVSTKVENVIWHKRLQVFFSHSVPLSTSLPFLPVLFPHIPFPYSIVSFPFSYLFWHHLQYKRPAQIMKTLVM